MPSLKDHYSRLQSVNDIGITIPVPLVKQKSTVSTTQPPQTVSIPHQTEVNLTQLVVPESPAHDPVLPAPSGPTAKQELVTRGLSAVFDPSQTSRGQTQSKSSRLSLSEAFELWLKRNPTAKMPLQAFLTSKLPADFPIVEARVTRQRGFLGTSFFPTYLFGEEADKGVGVKTSLLRAKKKSNNKTSNYPIFAKSENDSGEAKLGKLRSNFVGSHFVLFSEGANPEKAAVDEAVRKELLALTYEATKKKGPREIRAVIPVEKPKVPGKVLLEASELDDTVVHLANRKPRWNEHIQGYVLNFSKRVSEASVKNFQLVNKSDDVILQFGKVSKDDFSLDFKYPLSPLEAFGVALSAFDFKWCCE